MNATSSIHADVAAASMAREALSTFLGDQVTARFAEDAALLTSELVSNSVVHSGMAPTELIGLDLDMDLARLRVTVSDADAPFAPPSTKGIGGWGLVLVERISNRWGVHRNAPNSVWFELDREPVPDATPG